MEVDEIIAGIDEQIHKLTQARDVLAGISSTPAKAGRGRPKGSKNSVAAVKTARRQLTPEGRRRIAEAMKRRWAERRKTDSKQNNSK